MELIASPRRRRRLLWLVAIAAALAIAAAVVVLLPRQGGSGSRTFDRSAPGNPLAEPKGPNVEQQARDAAEARAAARAVRPSAEAFMNDVVSRKKLAEAYALLG